MSLQKKISYLKSKPSEHKTGKDVCSHIHPSTANASRRHCSHQVFSGQHRCAVAIHDIIDVYNQLKLCEVKSCMAFVEYVQKSVGNKNKWVSIPKTNASLSSIPKRQANSVLTHFNIRGDPNARCARGALSLGSMWWDMTRLAHAGSHGEGIEARTLSLAILAAEAAATAGVPVEHYRPTSEDVLLKFVRSVTEGSVVPVDRVKLQLGCDLLQLFVGVEGDGHDNIDVVGEGGRGLHLAQGRTAGGHGLGPDCGLTVVAHTIDVHLGRSIRGLGLEWFGFLGFVGGGRRCVTVVAVGTFMLLHVVLPGKGLVADGAADVLLASVLLAVAGSVTRSGEGVGTVVLRSVRARVLLLGRFCARAVGVPVGRRRGWGDGSGRRGQIDRRRGYQVCRIRCKLNGRCLERNVRVGEREGLRRVERCEEAGGLRHARQRLLGWCEVRTGGLTEVRVVRIAGEGFALVHRIDLVGGRDGRWSVKALLGRGRVEAQELRGRPQAGGVGRGFLVFAY